jgi:hypothetical protein
VEPSRARRAGGALLAVLVVALLLPIVALASRPEGPAGGGALLSADPARLVVDVATYLFLVFVLVSLAVIIWALWPRPDDEMPALPPRRRWMLSTIVTAVLFTAIALWLRGSGRLGRLPGVNAGAGAGGAPPALGQQVRSGAPPGFDWLAAGIVLVVVAAAAALAWWYLRPRARSGRLPLARLQAILDDAIDDVLGEMDPRRAVIAAWTRLERVLAGHGLPRRDSEAPFEYAARAGDELAVPVRWLEGLAELFEWARFSTHDVTPAMRDEALAGLRAVRDELPVAT